MDSETHDPIDLQTKELRYAIFLMRVVDKIIIFNIISNVYINKTFVPPNMYFSGMVSVEKNK